MGPERRCESDDDCRDHGEDHRGPRSPDGSSPDHRRGTGASSGSLPPSRAIRLVPTTSPNGSEATMQKCPSQRFL